MTARDCQKRITALKEWRMNKGYTVEQCIELCNGFPSDTTVRRIFNTNSGEKTFRESTIAALELALMGEVYNPEISIPVEDVIKAQKESAEAAEKTHRMQALQIAQQRANIRVRDFIIIAFALYEAFVIVYDRLNPHIGFYNTNSITVWVVQVTLLVVIGVILSVYILRTRLRERQMRQEGET